MWDKMTHEIKIVAKKMLGESRGFGPRVKIIGGGMTMF